VPADAGGRGRGHRRAPCRQRLIVRVILLVAVVASIPRPAAAQLAPGAVVVVLPFENPQADPRLLWLREGIAALLSDAIDAAGIDVVVRDERVAAFERLQLPVGATLSRASTVKVGQAVGASAMVVGRIELANDQLAVTARVVRLDSGRLSPDTLERAPLPQLFGLASALAGKLVGTGGAIAAWQPPPSLAAFELFSQGLVAETPSAERAYFEQALKAAPDYDAVRLALWAFHTEQGEHQRALDVVNLVRTGSRFEREGRFAAAMSLIRLKRDDEAFGVLRTMQSSTQLAVVANAIGVVQLRRGGTPQSGRATYFFTQATELDPNEGDYFFNLGYAYWLEKDGNAAMYWLREAVRRNPADGEAHFVLAAALQQSGAAAEAGRERELARQLSSRFTQWEARAAGGGELIPRGLERLHERLDVPSARLDTIITSSGQREQAALAAFHLDAARRAFEREQDREAEQALRRALYLSPYLAEAHLLLGRVYLRQGKEDAAVQALKIAVWSEPSARTHAALGEAYVAAENLPAARAELDRALAVDPRSPDAARLKVLLTKVP
jgi:tetratricopeptide (TPR) repeat protein/TolB-like protein